MFTGVSITIKISAVNIFDRSDRLEQENQCHSEDCSVEGGRSGGLPGSQVDMALLCQ